MLDIFNEVDEYDALIFLPNDLEGNEIRFEVCHYKEPGEPIGGSVMGPEYHIVLFQFDEEGPYNLDSFDAILVDAREYVSRMIKEDFYGVVAKKTTTSNDLVDTVKAAIDNMLEP